ncbi:MAG: 4Fe-4S binding protein [Rikenellaceae bacterium]|nr:4Fe-4S binding protein [Rikenellaceae bacterium]
MFKKKKRYLDIDISKMKCTGCGNCVDRCRHDVIKLKRIDDRAFAYCAKFENCVGCGRCAKACKNDAIYVTDLAAVDVDTLLRFY